MQFYLTAVIAMRGLECLRSVMNAFFVSDVKRCGISASQSHFVCCTVVKCSLSIRTFSFRCYSVWKQLKAVTELEVVCKEWLVREDSALAYKLQSQEINDFYKGNRQRNAVVREDFPTALHEQIKEKENAEKQAELYRRRLQELEEHDKRVAKDIAEKLERDLQEQQQRELQESEVIAQQMQEIYVNLPPPSRGGARDNPARPPPPRPVKASIQLQNPIEPSTSNGRYHHQHSHNQSQQAQPQNHTQAHYQPQSQLIQLQQQHFSNTDCYVGLSVQPPIVNAAANPITATTPTRQKQTQSNAPASTGQLLKLSPEKYDQLVGNDVVATAGVAAERHMQAHADDIELYADPCDYASLKEIGLPMEEIKEMSKKLKQEQKDELLARRLQEMEAGDGLTQEERDRLLAIEAQDKELAKMLQEREKAKAKRAKEKARLRKNQQKDPNSTSSSLCSTSNVLHCGPLLPLPQDCMSFSKHSSSAATVSNVNAHAQTVQEDPIDVEAYSNPIDVINNQQQRVQNGTLTNGSLTREPINSMRHDGSQQRNRDDDIYTLPVDSCRPGQRPASLNIGPESGHLLQHNSMTRSENYSLDSHDSLNGRDISPRMNYSKSGTFDQSSSPTPPYMPIQGTRRSNSSEDRKKKSKDKCTHQ